MSQLPPASVLVAHRVVDFDQWKNVFDETQSFREEDGIQGHDISRGADDPNRVYVYCLANDPAKLAAHVEKTELRQIMQRAGVDGPPEVWVMKPVSIDITPGQTKLGMVAIHDVQDYATWRQAYDDFDGARKEHGIIGHAVNQDVSNPNRVIVYHQAKTMGALKGLMASDELRDRMQQAGVVGKPDFHFFESVETKHY